MQMEVQVPVCAKDGVTVQQHAHYKTGQGLDEGEASIWQSPGLISLLPSCLLPWPGSPLCKMFLYTHTLATWPFICLTGLKQPSMSSAASSPASPMLRDIFREQLLSLHIESTRLGCLHSACHEVNVLVRCVLTLPTASPSYQIIFLENDTFEPRQKSGTSCCRSGLAWFPCVGNNVFAQVSSFASPSCTHFETL